MSAKHSFDSAHRFSWFRLFSVLLTSCIWIAPFCLAPASSAYASDTYTVTVNTDDYSGTPTTVTGTASNCPANATAAGCTLRDAITAANADTGSTIKFAVTGTNTLAFVLPVITTSTNIVGPGANALTISGGYQQFSVSGSAATTVNISGLTLANANNTVVGTGLMPSYAGAIYNLAATLTVDHVVFANNTTGQPSLPGEGGAILNNEGVLTVNDCTFIGNYTQYSGVGGAITSIGTLSVNGSSFIGNNGVSGSAIYSLSGLSITGSTFTGNTGVFSAVVFTSGTMTVKDSTFLNNIATYGPNYGTNIYNDGNPPTYPATLIVTNSVFDAPPAGYSCISTASPSDCPVNGVSGNVVDTVSDLKLASLGYYGGPTPTFLPLPGSPAHCAAPSSGFPGTDQRGFGRDIACGGGLTDAGSVQTNYLTVTTTADDSGSAAPVCSSSCTLRDAMNAAVADGNGDINFASGLSGTIALGKALPAIDIPGSVDIVGPGAGQITVSGANAYQIFNVAEGILDLSGLTVANAKAPASGGAIDNTGGTVTLSNVLLSGNSAITNGGAIYNAGALLVNDSTFSANKAASGSAIYNAGSLNAAYSTFAGNAVTTSGGIYNSSSAAATLANSTFALNTGSGAGIANNGSLAVTNSVLDTSAECSGSGCPAASGKGNVVGATHLAALGSYGGPTPTILPQPGSSAICAGSATLIPLFTAADQRGFPNDNITYTGYSATAPCVDSGAVQTNYTAVQFVGTGPYVAFANTSLGQNPAVIVSVTENGQNIGGVPVTLTFSGTGSASGLTATTVAGSGATFSSLLINKPSAPTDTLAVSLPVVGSDTLSAGPVNLTVNLPTPTTTFTVANHTYGDAPFAISATSNSTGAITYTLVSGPATIKGNVVTLTGAGTVVINASQAAAGNYLASNQTITINVAQASQSITFTGLPSSATYTVAGPYTLNGKASSGLAVSYAVTGPAKISGSTLTLTGPGTVVVTASQLGNTNYAAASSVSQTINVVPAFTISITPPTENVFGGNIAIFLMQIQASPGFNGKVTLGCSGGPSGSTCLDFPMTVQFFNGQALALSGVFFPANTKVGTYTMTFSGVSGAASGSATATFVVSNSNNSGGWF